MATEQRLNEDLERRVAERTAELLRINEELRQEISERQQVEEAQRKRQRQYEALVQSIDGIVWEVEAQSFRFVFVSSQAERLLGYPLEQWLNEPNFWASHLHPDDCTWAVDFCVAATERREDHQFEYRMIAADGRVVWLRDFVTVCLMDDQSVRLRGVMVDITESKRSAEALQKYATEIHDLYNQAPCGYHSLDQDGVYMEINETELQWLGLRREEVIGRLRFSDLLTPESQERFCENFWRFKEQGEVRDLEYQMVCKDGSLMSVLLSAVAVRDEAGNYLMSRATLYDITERKRAEEQVSLLQTITLEVAAARDLASALQVVLRRVCEKTSWVFGQAWLPRQDKTALDCGPAWFSHAGLENFRANSEGLQLLPGEGLPGRVWSSGQPEWVEDVTRDANFPRAEFALQSELKAAFALPILMGDEVIAVIEFFLRQSRSEDDRLVGLITAVAAQLGLAIERKRADDALRESESRWRTIYNDTILGIAMADAEGRLVQSNPALQRMLGYPEEEIRDRSFVEFTHPDDVDNDVALYRELLAGRRDHYQIEKRYLRKDGQVVWGNVMVSILRDEYGKGQLAVGMVEDITERKRAEASILKEKQLTEAILDSLPGIFYLYDEQGNRLRWNKNFEKITGYSAEEVARMGLWHNIAEEDKPVLQHAFETVFAKGQADGEANVVVKDGSRIPYYFTGQRALIDGEPHLIGMGIDISERKRAEEELRESQRRFSDTLTNVDMLAVMADIHGNITFCNDYLLRLTGWHRQEAIGRNWFAMFIPENEQPRVSKILEEIPRGGTITSHFENEIKTRSGERRLVKWTNTTLRDLDGQVIGVAAVGDDITERKRAERENRKLLHDLGERIKELTALHCAARILQHSGMDIQSVLAQLAALIPPAFQCPEITVARFRLGNIEARTPNFAAARAILRADFTTTDGHPGSIEVGYIEDCPPEVEGPFLGEERALINTLADMLRTSYDRQQAADHLLREKQLTEQIMNSLPGVCYVFDEQGRFLRWNENFERLTGYSGEEFARLNPIDLFIGKDKETDQMCLHHVFVDGESDAEMILVAKDGTRTPYYFTGRRALLGDKVCDVGMGIDITDRKRAEEQIKATSEQLRALTASLRSAREEEGMRIAREIHDELGSALTSLRWDLESLGKRFSESAGDRLAEQSRGKIAAMIGLTDSTIGTVRKIASELRPSVLDDLGLVEAIEWQAQQFQARTGIICHCDCSLEELSLSEEQSTAVFRIFQEALTNVLRHAQATRVEVCVAQEGDFAVLTVCDNGRGITEAQQAAPRSLGLLGMRERAHLVGGDIHINGFAGKGTVVKVRVPLS